MYGIQAARRGEEILYLCSAVAVPADLKKSQSSCGGRRTVSHHSSKTVGSLKDTTTSPLLSSDCDNFRETHASPLSRLTHLLFPFKKSISVCRRVIKRVHDGQLITNPKIHANPGGALKSHGFAFPYAFKSSFVPFGAPKIRKGTCDSI